MSSPHVLAVVFFCIILKEQEAFLSNPLCKGVPGVNMRREILKILKGRLSFFAGLSFATGIGGWSQSN